MSQRILLDVPDDVYNDMQRLANHRREPVEDVVVDTLRRAFPQWPIHPQRAEMEAEEAAFESMRESLLAHYEAQFVAIHGGTLVDHDADEVELLKRIRTRFPNQLVLLRQVTAHPLPPLRFRSPRLGSEP